MLRLEKCYPGMSGSVLNMLYSDWENPINTNMLCRPKEDIVFNYDMFFTVSDYYMAEKTEDSIAILCMDGCVKTGLVYLTEREFNQYFTIFKQEKGS